MELELPSAGFPILQTNFTTPPDCGEVSYHGTGKLQGLNVLVTGGDSGIGRAAVIAFTREGANVAINYLPEEEADAQDLADVLAEEKLSIERIPGDLTNETFCAHLVETAAERLGGLDILVGNAGYSSLRNNAQPVTNITTEGIERVYRTNVFANIWLARAAVPLRKSSGMRPTPSFQLTQDSSQRWQHHLHRLRDSSQSRASHNRLRLLKAAVVHLTKSLAIQLAPSGIRVNAVAPVLTYTPFFLSTMGISTEQLQMQTDGIPYGRVGQPAEMASLYVSLADPQNTLTSGEVYAAPGTLPAP